MEVMSVIHHVAIHIQHMSLRGRMYIWFEGGTLTCGEVDLRSFHQKSSDDMLEALSSSMRVSEGEKMKIWIAKSDRDKNSKMCLARAESGHLERFHENRGDAKWLKMARLT